MAEVRPGNKADKQQEALQTGSDAAGSGQNARDLMRRRRLAIGETKAKTELSTAAKAHQSESVSLSFCLDLSRTAAVSFPDSLRPPKRRTAEQTGNRARQNYLLSDFA